MLLIISQNFVKEFKLKKNLNICSIRSDHGGEFEKNDFIMFYDDLGINDNFSAPRTPQ